MASKGKNFAKALEGLDRLQDRTLEEAVSEVKQRRFAKFNEGVDLAIRLNVDPRHAEENLRGTVALPHGTGKDVRVLVFAKGDQAKEAEEAGADYVGAEELADRIQKENWLDFEACVATPDMMRVVGRLGKILGPRGMMPNPKVGTVTTNVADTVKELKAGKIEFKVEKKGIVHTSIGKVEFTDSQLVENASALLNEIKRIKPSTVKGAYFKSVTLSSTMGPGIRVSVSE